MKKSLIMVLVAACVMMFLAPMLMAGGTGQTNVGTVNAAAQKKVLVSSMYTVMGVQLMYNAVTVVANERFFLDDAANTYTAAAQTITLTVKDLQTTDGYYSLGMSGVATNGSGVGTYYGIKFANGVVLNGAPDGVSLTVGVIGK